MQRYFSMKYQDLHCNVPSCSRWAFRLRRVFCIFSGLNDKTKSLENSIRAVRRYLTTKCFDTDGDQIFWQRVNDKKCYFLPFPLAHASTPSFQLSHPRYLCEVWQRCFEGSAQRWLQSQYVVGIQATDSWNVMNKSNQQAKRLFKIELKTRLSSKYLGSRLQHTKLHYNGRKCCAWIRCFQCFRSI